MSCKERCQYPHKLKDKPENCTPEQMRECHGDEAGHPCVQPEQGEQKDLHNGESNIKGRAMLAPW